MWLVAFVFGSLVFIYFTSKGIIVFNEETLVVLTFFIPADSTTAAVGS